MAPFFLRCGKAPAGPSRIPAPRCADSGQLRPIVQRVLKFIKRSTKFQRSLKNRAATAQTRGTT
jgi:hypothetical protein